MSLMISLSGQFPTKIYRERITFLAEKSHLTQTETAGLEGLCETLVWTIKEFRQHQCVITPRLPDRFKKGQSADLEGFVLGLPSESTDFSVTELGAQEATIHMSHASDIIDVLHNTCRKLETLLLYKDQNVSTEDMCTRQGKNIQNMVVS